MRAPEELRPAWFGEVKDSQPRCRPVPARKAAGQLIRHREVGRKALASSPEGPGFNS